MFIICFTLLRDGDLSIDIYNCPDFCSAMVAVNQLIDSYALIPADVGDCGSITVLYNTHTILTLNSDMF